MEEKLCKELNLIGVTVPLIVDVESDVNDLLESDGARTFMLILKKAHIGEVSATIWPKILKEMCKKKNIYLIE